MLWKVYLALGAVLLSIYAATMFFGWEYGSPVLKKSPPSYRSSSGRSSGRRGSGGFFYGGGGYGGGK